MSSSEKHGSGLPTKPIEQVLNEHTSDLMRLQGVVGTAQTLRDGKPCILVMVLRRTPELERQIPSRLEGHRVWILETGEFRARPGEDEAEES